MSLIGWLRSAWRAHITSRFSGPPEGGLWVVGRRFIVMRPTSCRLRCCASWHSRTGPQRKVQWDSVASVHSASVNGKLRHLRAIRFGAFRVSLLVVCDRAADWDSMWKLKGSFYSSGTWNVVGSLRCLRANGTSWIHPFLAAAARRTPAGEPFCDACNAALLSPLSCRFYCRVCRALQQVTLQSRWYTIDWP